MLMEQSQLMKMLLVIILNTDKTLGDLRELFYNLYAYCSNVPTSTIDENGNIGLLLGCIIIGGAVKSKDEKGKAEPEAVLGYGAVGALIGIKV